MRGLCYGYDVQSRSPNIHIHRAGCKDRFTASCRCAGTVVCSSGRRLSEGSGVEGHANQGLPYGLLRHPAHLARWMRIVTGAWFSEMNVGQSVSSPAYPLPSVCKAVDIQPGVNPRLSER